jgi:hypothetical protein
VPSIKLPVYPMVNQAITKTFLSLVLQHQISLHDPNDIS